MARGKLLQLNTADGAALLYGFRIFCASTFLGYFADSTEVKTPPQRQRTRGRDSLRRL
jgi:hypothetical protein